MLQNLSAIELESRPNNESKARLKAGASPLPAPGPSVENAPTSNNQDESMVSMYLTKGRSNIVIAMLSLVLFLNSVASGFLTVGLPKIAADLKLEESLLLWPQSVYGLTSGSCLLLAGAVADVIGSRLVNLTGTFFVGIFIIACGLPNTGVQLIMFRAVQGIAIALCLPTSMGILSTAIASGTRRNIAFSCLGLGQVIGFGFGLILSGVFIDTLGWRAGFYMTGAVTLVLFLVGIWALPANQLVQKPTLKRLARETDWVGAGISSSFLAMLSYVLASVSPWNQIDSIHFFTDYYHSMITSDVTSIRKPVTIALLSLSVALVPAFIFWVGRQERLQKPALIPNSIWKNTAFTAVCLIVLLSFAVMQTMELFVSLL